MSPFVTVIVAVVMYAASSTSTSPLNPKIILFDLFFSAIFARFSEQHAAMYIVFEGT